MPTLDEVIKVLAIALQLSALIAVAVWCVVLRRRRQTSGGAPATLRKITLNLPFDLGSMEFEPDEAEVQAAWKLYVELSTRISTQELPDDVGSVREALSSLYAIFDRTRAILKEAGPQVAHGDASLGPVAIAVLNRGLRGFLAKWHPMLASHEALRAKGDDPIQHERAWRHHDECRAELKKVRQNLAIYAKALEDLAHVDMC